MVDCIDRKITNPFLWVCFFLISMKLGIFSINFVHLQSVASNLTTPYTQASSLQIFLFYTINIHMHMLVLKAHP